MSAPEPQQLSLDESQRQLTALITTTGGIDSNREALPLRSGSIDLYRQCHQQSLYNSLLSAYPLTLQWLGNDCFQRLTKSFLHQHHSQHWDLNHYPLAFSQYLKDLDDPSLYCQQKSLVSLAEIDATLHAYYYAYRYPILPQPQPQQHSPPLNSPFDLSRLATMNPQQQQELCFTANPQLRLLTLDDEITDFVRQHKSIDFSLLTQRHSRHLIISRQGLHNNLCFVDDDFFFFLYQLLAKKTLSQCFDNLATTTFADSLNPDALLIAVERRWLIDYSIAEVNTNNSPPLDSTLSHRNN